jgi:hypothetical protein
VGDLTRARIHANLAAKGTVRDFFDEGFIIEDLDGCKDRICIDNYPLLAHLADLNRSNTPDWLKLPSPGWVFRVSHFLSQLNIGDLRAYSRRFL